MSCPTLRIFSSNGSRACFRLISGFITLAASICTAGGLSPAATSLDWPVEAFVQCGPCSSGVQHWRRQPQCVRREISSTAGPNQACRKQIIRRTQHGVATADFSPRAKVCDEIVQEFFASPRKDVASQGCGSSFCLFPIRTPRRLACDLGGRLRMEDSPAIGY